MKSDFSRLSFDPSKHFSRVLQQQGKVTLDADSNEQTSILLHYLQTLAKDLIGPHAAPREGGGFLLADDGKGGILISAGRYYVDGILLENEANCSYFQQPDFRPGKDDPIQLERENYSGKTVWLYLDVWERHISALEDDAIREKALGGVDTCARSKVVWQVKAKYLEDGASQEEQAKRQDLLIKKAEIEKQIKDLSGGSAPASLTADSSSLAGTPRGTPAPTSSPRVTPTPSATPLPSPAPNERLDQLLKELAIIEQELAALDSNLGTACERGMASVISLSNAGLAARIDPGPQTSGPCIIAPDAQYRGAENHLYRVEIHRGGKGSAASFKWSRENGSVASSWLGTQGFDLQVGSSRGFAAGDWVELSHDELELNSQAGVMVKLAKVEAGLLSIDPNSVALADSLTWHPQMGHPKIRRWDQRENDVQKLVGGVIAVKESNADEEVWLNLEDGVQIRFDADGEYRCGDYWLIPARVGLDQIDNWPCDPITKQALSISPHGIEHHYAPLGVAVWQDGQWDNEQLQSCYCQFDQLAYCPDQQRG